ncbi:MAG: pseudouridylate synthase [Deltaproteobacteria bacterium]|nr:pseudouridylate synthase [Deltaproteobacteria bacterium]
MILHRDARCVVVDKPAGVATHRGWDGDDDALLQRVRDAVGMYVYPVHRLDRGASGATLFALDKEAARAFSDAWSEARKIYLAITRGHPPDELVIDHAIPSGPGEDRVPAVTEVRRLETFGRYALVEARPRTGRLHQIRRHLKHIACPLVGDVRYGKGEHNRIFRTQHDLHRLALHAASLAVPHPDGGTLSVESPLPDDLARAIASCRRVYV